MSIKKGVSDNGSVWGRDSHFHQKHDFLPHITQCLLSQSPMSMLVKV
jgi:hypothetical protein